MSTSPTTRRVVVTGMGAVTSLGPDLASTWNGILTGQSGIHLIRQYGETTEPTHIAGQVDLSSLPLLPDLVSADSNISVAHLGRAARFALHAATEAWKHAGLEEHFPDATRAGVCLGASTFPIIEDRLDRIGDLLEGDRWNSTKYAALCRENPWLLTQSDAASIASLIADKFSLQGLSLTAQAACTSATQAIGHAFHCIRSGRANVLLAGGTDSMLSMMCVTGFSLLGSLSQRWPDPARASRPFDRTRDGFVLAEGSSILVLEELQHALSRNATIHGEIIGYGSSCDAYRFTDMHPEGNGAVLCMQSALRDAQITKDDIGYINAHGTATPLNDRIETLALRRVFQKHADKLAVSSTKSQLGHLLCAAGAIETTLTVLAVKHGILPATINLDNPDPECDLDYIPWKTRNADTLIALSNSFGFGGQNGSIAIRRWEPRSAVAPSTVTVPLAVTFSTPEARPRAVCITGVGIVSPLGLNIAEHQISWKESNAATTRAAPGYMQRLGIPYAACVKGFDTQQAISNRMLRKIFTRAASHALQAAGEALQSAGMSNMAEASLYVGSLGLDQDLDLFGEALRTSLDTNHRFSYLRFQKQGMALIDPLFLVKSLPNAGLCGTAIEYGLHGPNLNIMNGPSSGLLAVAAAADAIQSGRTDIAITGGYDSPLQLEAVVSHLVEGRLQLAEKMHGYVLGEGAAFFVLEEKSSAIARGANVYAEIKGIAQSHSTPHYGVDSLVKTARQALHMMRPDAVFGDGLNLREHDALEHSAAALSANGITIQSSTHLTGYCGVASPLFSLMHAVLAIQQQTVIRPLVWTSDRSRDHVAVALCRGGAI